MEKFIEIILGFINSTGIAMFFVEGGWKNLIMIILACILMYLAIKKKFEPYLLLPISFAMLLINLPGVKDELFVKTLVEGTGMEGVAAEYTYSGLFGYLYYGVKFGIYPCLIFLCIGATTDFGPLIANKKTMLLGAASQIGIFITFIGAIALGFNVLEASSIGIIGGADGPTAILVTSKMAPELLGSISIAAYSYMALVPVILPPVIKLLTTKKERQIKMEQVREVSKTERILFPIIVSIVVILIIPSCAPLIGCLMLGNLIKETGIVPKICETLSNSLLYIVTILLGLSVGATATAETFLTLDTLMIFGLGIFAFATAAACGVLVGKLMCVCTKGKINPMIGAAGVVQQVGKEEDPNKFLLMHAMGPNVAGVIGSAIAAGLLMLLFL